MKNIKFTPKNIGIGIAMVLLLFIATAFIFQETTITGDLLEDDVSGEQVFIEYDSLNFFAKVTNFIKGIFSNTFSVALPKTTFEVGERFTATSHYQIPSNCQPSSGFVQLGVGSSGLGSWTYTSLPSPGSSGSKTITYTPTRVGTHKFTEIIYGDNFARYFGECYVPSETENKYCAILDSQNCPILKVSECYNNVIDDQIQCFLDTTTFNVVEPVIEDCPNNYCDDWERVGSIFGGDEYEQVCYIYGSAPTCSKSTDVNIKVTCDDGYQKIGDRCEEIPPPPSSTTTSTTTTSTSVTTTTLNDGNDLTGFAISDLFDYENHSTQSYITLSVLMIILVAGVVFIPFGKGGKK